jgi:hypothetical protein
MSVAVTATTVYAAVCADLSWVETPIGEGSKPIPGVVLLDKQSLQLRRIALITLASSVPVGTT